MIKYRLNCKDCATAFDSWFSSSKEYEKLKKFKHLKIVSVFGVGYDGVDINYCRKNNIQVTNTPDVLTNDVSDLGIGLLISLSRRIIDNHYYTKKING